VSSVFVCLPRGPVVCIRLRLRLSEVRFAHGLVLGSPDSLAYRLNQIDRQYKHLTAGLDPT